MTDVHQMTLQSRLWVSMIISYARWQSVFFSVFYRYGCDLHNAINKIEIRLKTLFYAIPECGSIVKHTLQGAPVSYSIKSSQSNGYNFYTLWYMYCYEFVNIACKFVIINCFCIIISQTYSKYYFSERSCIILAKF